jgi:hypothetical protein
MSSTASLARRRCSRGSRAARPSPLSSCLLRATAVPAPGTAGRTDSGPPRALAHEPGLTPAPISAPHASRGEAKLGPDGTDGTTPAPTGPAPAPRRERTRANRRQLSFCTNEPERDAAGPGIGGGMPAPAIPCLPLAWPLWHRYALSPAPRRPSPAPAGKPGAWAAGTDRTVPAANEPAPADRRQRQERPPAANQPERDLAARSFGRNPSARTNPGPLPAGPSWLERIRKPVPTGSSPGSAGWAAPHTAGADGRALAPNEPEPANRHDQARQRPRHPCTSEPKRGVDAPTTGWSASAQTSPGVPPPTQFPLEQTQASAGRSSPGSVQGTTPRAAGAHGTALGPNEPDPATRHEHACQRLRHSCTNEPKRDVEAAAVGQSASAQTSPGLRSAMQFLHEQTRASARHSSFSSVAGATLGNAGADGWVFATNGSGPVKRHEQARHRLEHPGTNESERNVEAPAIGRSGSDRTTPYSPPAMQFQHGQTQLSGRRPSRGSAGGTTRRAAGADGRVFAPNEPGPAQRYGRTRFYRRHKPPSGKRHVARTNPSAMSMLQLIARSVAGQTNPGPRSAMHFLHERTRAPARLLSSPGLIRDSRPVLLAPMERCSCRPERAL